MSIPARIVSREIGTALAVLAIYVLTLLLPLHQAAAQQRDLDALGYSTLAGWSVCTQLAADEDGDPREAAALSCPALGVAKHQLALDLPQAPVFAAPTVSSPIRHSADQALATHLRPPHSGQSRAPPAAA